MTADEIKYLKDACRDDKRPYLNKLIMKLIREYLILFKELKEKQNAA